MLVANKLKFYWLNVFIIHSSQVSIVTINTKKNQSKDINLFKISFIYILESVFSTIFDFSYFYL